MTGEEHEKPEWIELETVHRLHSRQLAEHGGAAWIRDEGLLLSTMNRPIAKWDYESPRPDSCELAAAYTFGIAKNHPFLDGNERTAAMMCEVFLILNGLQPTASEDEKYPVYLALAAGELHEDSFVAWLRKNTRTV